MDKYRGSISKYAHAQICLFEKSLYSLVFGGNQLNEHGLSVYSLQDHL